MYHLADALKDFVILLFDIAIIEGEELALAHKSLVLVDSLIDELQG